MADNANPPAQDNTTNAAQGSDGAGTASLLTTEPTGDAGNKGADQAAGTTNNADDAGKAPEGEGQTDNKDGKPEGAPEKYEFALPDGMQVDEDAAAAFEPIARELNLTNEQANKLASLYAERMQNTVKSQHDAWKTQLETWVSDVKADKEIGGQQLDTSVKHAQSALTKFGTPELKSALDNTGMGNHPELVRVFARIGKAMAEDTFVAAGKQQGESDQAKKMFPEMK